MESVLLWTSFRTGTTCFLATSTRGARAWILRGDWPSAGAAMFQARGLAIARLFCFLRIEPDEVRYFRNSSERTALIHLFRLRMNRLARRLLPTGAGSYITRLYTLKTTSRRQRG